MPGPDCLILHVTSVTRRHPWGERQQFVFDDDSTLERATAYYRPTIEAYVDSNGEVTVAEGERSARLYALGEIAAKFPEQTRIIADFLGESVIPTQHVL